MALAGLVGSHTAGSGRIDAKIEAQRNAGVEIDASAPSNLSRHFALHPSLESASLGFAHDRQAQPAFYRHPRRLDRATTRSKPGAPLPPPHGGAVPEGSCG